jgi:hypothetical protein
MSAAPATPFPQDRNLDWLDELHRVASAAESLTPAAREALLAVIESFAREDGGLSREARRAVLALRLRLVTAVA